MVQYNLSTRIGRVAATLTTLLTFIPTFSPSQTLVWHVMGISPSFGSGVLGLGDVNADGTSDFGVLGFNPSYPTLQVGRINVISGLTGQDLAIIDPPPGETALASGGSAGDVDLDGLPDLIVLTAPSGTTYGPSVARVGDLTGDGIDEIAVGGSQQTLNPTLPGSAYVISPAPAGITAFGSACAGPGGLMPRIGASGLPAAGFSLTFNVSRIPVGSTAVLLVGTSNVQWGPYALPLDLTPFQLPGCTLLTSIEDFVATPANSFGPVAPAAAAVTIPFVGLPSLTGARFFAQWAILNPAGAPAPLHLTSGLQIEFF